MSRSTPSSPPLSPRQRLSYLFPGSGRTGSSAASVTSATNTISLLSPPRKDGGGLTSQTASHDGMQRTRSHRLSRLTSPFKGGDVALVRSPGGTTSNMSPTNRESPLLDLPPTSSDLQGDYVDSANTSLTRSAISRSSSHQHSRPTSPSKVPLSRSLSMQTGTSVHVTSPSISPNKRTGPFMFNRPRKNSDVVLREDGGRDRLPSGRHSSRPVSPVRANSEHSLFPYRRKSVAASVIGLPTNLKHTSGISAAPLRDALQLAGLTARDIVSRGQSSKSDDEQTFPRASPEPTSALLEKEESLEDALAQVEKALDGMPARFTNQQFQRSASAPEWQKTNWTDRDNELSSGFKQRLGSAGQMQSIPIPEAVVLMNNEEPPLSTVGDNRSTRESTSRASKSKATKSSLRSPAMSPVRSLHRKPVPKLEDDLPTETTTSSPQTEALPDAETAATGRRQQLLDSTIPETPPCASVKPSQDWSATLAEISAALKA